MFGLTTFAQSSFAALGGNTYLKSITESLSVSDSLELTHVMQVVVLALTAAHQALAVLAVLVLCVFTHGDRHEICNY